MRSAQLQWFASDPAALRSALLIDADGLPVRFGDVADDWQAEDLRALDSAWLSVTGRSVECLNQRAYLERPRGHSKTSDLAVMATWALDFSPRQLSGVAAAADRDQAKLLRDAIEKLLRLNTWLAGTLEVQNWKVTNTRTGSTLEILSSDVASSYGLTPDFVIIDELTHWPRRDLWDSLISSSAKRKHCVVVVISNAGPGMGSGWRWSVRETCRESNNWYFSRLDGPQASWITPNRLEEQQRLLPPKVYQRLWLNLWQTDVGDALDSSDIELCITLDGPISNYDNSRTAFVGSLDLGLKHDHSALVVTAIDVPTQRLRLALCQSWAPPNSGEKV